MSTPCRIIRKNTDGTLTVISCHWDGYPDGVGKTLANYYSDQASIDRLMSLGDLSMLGETPFLNPRYWDFDGLPNLKDYRNEDEYTEACNACYRQRSRFCGSYAQRGETDTAAVTVKPRDYSKVGKEDGPYEYVWNGHEWKYREYDYGQERMGRLRKLTATSLSPFSD